MKVPKFPILIKEQSVTVKIYRYKARTTKSGYAYCVTWVGSTGRDKKTHADLTEAKEFGHLRARQLAAGLSRADQLSRSDAIDLAEARRLAGDVPLLSAMAEWQKAREIAGPALLEACTAWVERRAPELVRLKIADAVDKFIAAKEALGKQGVTYRSKLSTLRGYFPDTYLDAITAQQWTKCLNRCEDAVTRNDLRKRGVTLCRWAQRNGHLPEGLKPEIEKTERAKEKTVPIGILTPAEYARVLEFFRKHHPEYLAGVVLAGFCGVRIDEIQGKRSDRTRRQSWEDIHFDQEFLSVTAAKENTPSSRIVHLQPAATAWLKTCPNREGPICAAGGLEKARLVAREAGFVLPDNCYRHSFITYRIALTGDKHSTATEAGNSVAEIDRRYRVPKPKAEGEAWFAIMPPDV